MWEKSRLHQRVTYHYQSRGIFGDEVMIAAAAKLSTYMTDINAVESMMVTLANYAAGISNDQVVEPSK